MEIKVPSVGESVTEVYITQWLKQTGEAVQRDEPLVELETDKASVEVPAPSGGQLGEILKKAGESAAVGEVLGHVDENAAPASGEATGEADTAKQEATEQPTPAEPTGEADRRPAGEQPTWVMPAAERALAEHNLRAEEVTPTGHGGRLLKEDVHRHVQRTAAGGDQAAPAADRAKEPAPSGEDQPEKKGEAPPGEDREEEAVPMSPMRRRIAQRLVEAQQTTAALTTFNECDLTGVKAIRERYRDAFQEHHGVKLGFMSFFVKATVEALKRFPELNAEIRDDHIVYRNHYDVGIAVSTPKGLIVPVIRSAERRSFAEIEEAVVDFGKRGQENKIGLEELQGGTFTITNGGIFGSLLSTPLLNPPQSGILGMHTVQDRPVAVDGRVEVRPMMYVALTYDHRIVDGREAVLFLRHIKSVVEEPSRMLLEI